MPGKDFLSFGCCNRSLKKTKNKTKEKHNIAKVILKHILFTKSIHFKISIYILNNNNYHYQSIKCILNEVVFTPRGKKTLETGLHWTRYQICTVIKQLCTSLVKAFNYILTQSIPFSFLYTGDHNPFLSVHVQHIILYCLLWHIKPYSIRRFPYSRVIHCVFRKLQQRSMSCGEMLYKIQEQFQLQPLLKGNFVVCFM